MSARRGAGALTTATATVIVFSAVGLAGCSTPTVRATDCTAYQDPFRKAVVGHTYPLTLALLDLHDNGPEEAERIGTALRPHLHDALRTGAYVSVIADGGQGTQTRHSACFAGADAAAPFLIHSGSDTHDADDADSYAPRLKDQVTAFVRSVPVTGHGSATRLLALAGRLAADARATGRVSDVNLLVYTDMLGNSTPGDCLNVNGVTASPATASALAARCLRSGQLQPLPVHSLRFLGAGQGSSTTEQALLATSLTAELCPRLTPHCREGAPTP